MENIFDITSAKGSREWSLFSEVREDTVSMFGTPRYPAVSRKLRIRHEAEYRPLVLQH